MRMKNIFLFVCAMILSCGHVAASEIEHVLPPQYEYWPDGTPRGFIVHSLRGKVVARAYFRHDGTLEKTETFDDAGNRLSVANYGSRNRLTENIDGWAAMRWAYDDDGKLREESYYREDGRIKERKIFSASGNMIGRQYYGKDEDIDDTEELNRGSIVRYETDEFYDEYGLPKGDVTIERW